MNYPQVLLNQLTKGWIPPPGSSGSFEKQRVLLVHAHPLPSSSFSGALARAVLSGLQEAGHEVVSISLYSDTKPNFSAALTADERTRYMGPTASHPNLPAYPVPGPDVRASIDELQKCTAIVFVYPTWWFNVPGVLKGWLDRVFLPGVAFKLPHIELEKNPDVEVRGGLVPGLPNIKKLGIVSTYGSPRHIAFLLGDNGTNMLCRSFLPLFAKDCQVHYHGLFSMDTREHEDRQLFVEKVREHYKTRF